jgi:enoyl-CoA hydratase
MEWILKSAPEEKLDAVVEAMEASGLMNTQRMATLFDGISRHSPEGLNFKTRVEAVDWKQTARVRVEGSYDWTNNKPFDER